MPPLAFNLLQDQTERSEHSGLARSSLGGHRSRGIGRSARTPVCETGAVGEPRQILYPPAKRAFDKLVAGALLLGLSPLAALALAAMAVDMAVVPADRGRWLYRETRVSAGRRFALLKFRTLREDALRRAGGHARPLEQEPANLTWAGRLVLKRWYLDELPQLVNVLRGEISLVGPRPWTPAMVRYQLALGYEYRLRVIAGWTGPAQVRKGFPVRKDDFSADLAYVASCAGERAPQLIRRDLSLLVETARTLARGGGLRD